SAEPAAGAASAEPAAGAASAEPAARTAADPNRDSVELKATYFRAEMIRLRIASEGHFFQSNGSRFVAAVFFLIVPFCYAIVCTYVAPEGVLVLGNPGNQATFHFRISPMMVFELTGLGLTIFFGLIYAKDLKSTARS